MARAPLTLTKFAAPAGALLALGVAVGVWVIPGTALDPKPPGAPISKPMPGAGLPRLAPPEPPEVDWTVLAQNLSQIREPVVEPETVADIPDTPRPENDPGMHPITPQFTLSWQYEGYVQEADRIIALVRIGGDQRFVFPGTEVVDPSIPIHGKATIKLIEPDTLTVTVGDRDIEIARETPPPPNELVRDQLSRAGRAD